MNGSEPTKETPIEHSRAMRFTGPVSEVGEGVLHDHMDVSTVAVSVDYGLPGSLLSARTLLATLRRMPCRLLLDPTGLPSDVVDELVTRICEIDPERGMIVQKLGDIDVTCHLHVGTDPRLSAVRLVPEGHGGHVIGDATVVVRPTREPSALGSIYVAALGAGEAFKRIAKVRDEKRVDHPHLSFCPVSLTTDLSRAPDIPSGLAVDLALIGVGAVGTAHALILSALQFQGKITLVDDERFDLENRGTYALGTDKDARAKPYKVDLAGQALNHYKVTGFKGLAANYIDTIDSEGAHWPSIVLSGLDTVEARHDAQRIWPDHLIDSATGDTVVGLHHATSDGPCLMCFLPKQNDGPDPIEELAGETGLPAASLREDAPLTEEDIVNLPEEKRIRLVEHVGRSKCGLAKAFGLSELQSGGFRPSIPFVSLQAACLGVGRLIAVATGFEMDSNFFQYDALLAPDPDAAEWRARSPSCYCVERSSLIKTVREARRSS
jgi:hypothetical protein